MMYRGFGLFLALIGIYFVWHFFQTRRQLTEAERWPSTPGEILESEVRRRPGRKPVHEARIRYRYEANGQTYTGKAVKLGGDLRGSRVRAEGTCERYPVGSRREVYYDPGNPATACLERSHEGGWLEIVGGVFGLAAGLWLLLVGPS